MRMEANAKILDYCKFLKDPQFDNSELKANPDGILKGNWEIKCTGYHSRGSCKNLIRGRGDGSGRKLILA